MAQVNPQEVIAHQSAMIYQKDQAFSQMEAYAKQLEEANKGLAGRYKQLQEKSGIAKDDPLYINFDAPPAPLPPAPPANR